MLILVVLIFLLEKHREIYLIFLNHIKKEKNLCLGEKKYRQLYLYISVFHKIKINFI